MKPEKRRIDARPNRGSWKAGTAAAATSSSRTQMIVFQEFMGLSSYSYVMSLATWCCNRLCFLGTGKCSWRTGRKRTILLYEINVIFLLPTVVYIATVFLRQKRAGSLELFRRLGHYEKENCFWWLLVLVFNTTKQYTVTLHSKQPDKFDSQISEH